MPLRIVLYIFFSLSVFAFCQSCNKAAMKSAQPVLNYGTSDEFSPEVMVYHTSDETSRVYLKLNSENLLYTRNSATEEFFGKVQFKMVITNLKNDSIIKQLNYFIESKQSTLNESLLVKSFEFELASQSDYRLHTEVIDLNRNISSVDDLFVNKTDQLTKENFLIFSGTSEVPAFNTSIERNKDLIINSNRVKISDLTIKFKEQDFGLPPPPYSSSKDMLPELFEFEPIEIESENNSLMISKDLVTSDLLLSNSENDGMMLLVRDSDFPLITSYENLIKPLRYISAKKEFDRLKNGINPKAEFEKFWVNCGDSKERAKVLIDEYYGRVELANRYFSSHKSGWQTDRGLIYIVFGAPTEIDMSSSNELWIYGDRTNISSVEFKFVKENNPFSSNHFVLERDPIYKSEWARRVESWRNGRILN